MDGGFLLARRLTQVGLSVALLAASCAKSPLAPFRASAEPAQPPKHDAITMAPGTLKFSTPPGVPSCATVAVLRGDPTKGPSVVMQRTTAGCRIPWHWHTPNEEVMVVKGGGMLEMKDGLPLRLQPGAYAFLPGHHVHRASCVTACTLFVSSDGVFDIHYVDETGKEISADEALTAPPPRRPKKTRHRK